ncbi:MAG TPA: RagB/SusD family nutrient uptake outer membrane protein [Mucilaginibacter sp.]|jgi:hypothetical protein
MKKIILALNLLILIISISSCNKSFLDKKPLNSFSDADVWSDLNLVQAFVNSKYRALPNFDALEKAESLSPGCDEGFAKFNWIGEINFVTGVLSPDIVTYDTWSSNYGYIRNCNLFFNKIGSVPANGPTEEALKKELIGEMKFIRAYCYFDLIQRYGGVPIITKLYGLQDTSYSIARNSYDECVNFIVSDLDSAALLLPAKQDDNNFGRASATAALALKSRLLLYAASPLNNPSNTSTKWQAAADATKAAIDLAEGNGGQLYQNPDYKRIFLDKQNPEIILSFNLNQNPGTGIDLINSPNSYNGWSAFAPSQNLVDEYELNNGKLITDPTSGYDPANPYLNRENRFYADILYNGAPFRGSNVETFVGGKDSPQSPEQPWNATLTGYNWRKYMDETIDFNSVNSNQNWIIFRLAELYLNYAEAEYALSNEPLARQYVNKVRARASVNLPPVTETGTALRDRIYHERQIELCFEAQRIFDVRRWKIAAQTENQPLQAVTITKTGSTFTYSYSNLQTRVFDPAKNYLWPIPRYEMNKNPLLTQNPGY